MSDFEQNSQPIRHQTSGAVWSVAALSAFVFLLSVLGAKLLSHWVESDSATRIAYDRAMHDVAAKAASPKTPETYSVVRSLGIDGITTATIPVHKAAPVSPCGDDRAVGAPGK
jgi:hypothetical protein